MANTYFSFKEFTIHQDKCAMKVCTDASLFGAWAVQQISKHHIEIENVLDIGSGTGLLSLMVAQQFEIPIDAVEINAEAAKQATENIKASPFKAIKVHHTAIEDFIADKKYDFIICNPPFYEGDLMSPDETRNAAMHNSYLTLKGLLASITKLLGRDGYAAILLPAAREKHFTDLLAAHNLQAMETTFVRQSVKHGFFRVMFMIRPGSENHTIVSEISIYNEGNVYTPEFKTLLKDYYLAF